MTAAKLKELVAKATEGPWVESGGNVKTKAHFSKWGKSYLEEGMVSKLVCVQPHDAELIAYLRNHCSDFIRLMEAAEEAAIALNMGLGQQEAKYEQAVTQAVKSRDMLTEALAAFKEKS